MSPARPERAPAERQSTIRSELVRHLRQGGPMTARELSGRVGVAERAVADHLEHVARSLRAAGERLQVEPARCLECGFVFRKRERLGKPSACPVCRSQHVAPPRFRVLAS